MPIYQAKVKPSSNYNITLFIRNFDYSSDVQSVRIISSLTSIYQAVVIDLFTNIEDILSNQIYGQDNIILSIELIGQENNIREKIDLDLLFLNHDFNVSQNLSTNYTKQPNRGMISLFTVVKKAYQIMSANVNLVHGATTPKKNISQILNDIIIMSGGIPKIDQNGINENLIDQICIPPTTLTNAIKYLDDTFGIYNGVMNSSCSNDGYVKIINMSTQIKNSPIMTIVHTSLDTSMKNDFDKKKFITHNKITTCSNSNSKFGVFGHDINHIIYPKDKLFKIINMKLDEIGKKYGLIDSNGNFYIDQAIQRKKYYTGHTGNDDDETFANAMIAKALYNMSNINVTLNRNLYLKLFFNTGSPVMIDSEMMNALDICGMYILSVSDILIQRSPRDFTADIELELIRTNKSI